MKIEKERIFLATIGEDYKNIAKKYGFGIEMDQFSFSQTMDSEKEIAAVWEELDGIRGQKPLIMHGPFTEIFPAAIDPKARLFSMERLKQCYELARRFGVDKMVVHSGYVPFTYFKSWQVERSIEFWSEFLAWIGEKRAAEKLSPFTLLVENVLDDEPDMLFEIMKGIYNPAAGGNCTDSGEAAKHSQSGEFCMPERAAAAWPREFARIGVCLDIGHANCISPVPLEAWIDRLAPYLMHTHIHNNFGERGKDLHLPPAEGALDVKTLIEKIEKMTAAGLCGSVTYTEECMDCEAAARWFSKNF